MDDFRFIACSDLHLDSPLHGLVRYEGAPVEAIRGATRRALENLVRLAIDEKVAFVLVAGDLYDGDWRDYGTGMFLHQQMVKLAEAEIRVFIVKGNHDADNRMTRHLDLPKNCTILPDNKPKTVLLKDLRVAIHGQGYDRFDVDVDLAFGFPAAEKGYLNIGLLHTALMGTEGHARYAPTTEGVLRSKGYGAWILGHIHARRVICEEPLILFPGNIQGRHAKETGAKGCTLVSVRNGDVVGHEHRDLHTVRWERIDVDATGCEAAGDIFEAITSRVRELAEGKEEVLALRIVVSGNCRAHEAISSSLERIHAEVRTRVNEAAPGQAWVEKIEFDTDLPVEAEPMRPGDPLSEMMSRLGALLPGDESVKVGLMSDIKMLKEKLPPELFDSEQKDIAPFDADETVSRLLAMAKGRLFYALSGKEGQE